MELASRRAPAALHESVDLYEVISLDKGELWALPAREQRKRIRCAYFALARLYHPDKIAHVNPEDKRAALEQCQRITVAYGILYDEQQKRNYDREIKSNTWGKMLSRHYWQQLRDDVIEGLTSTDPRWRIQMGISSIAIIGGILFVSFTAGLGTPVAIILGGAAGGAVAGAGQLTLCENLKLKHRAHGMHGMSAEEYAQCAALGAAIGAG